MIEIFAPTLQHHGDNVRIASQIIVNGESKELWFETQSQFQDLLATDTLDGFVVAMLGLAFKGDGGGAIYVNGPMSTKLYYNLTHCLIPILALYFKRPPVSIHCDTLVRLERNDNGGVISGLSCGVDSFCTYYQHSGDRSPPDYHITHFIFNNVGSHGQCGEEEDHNTFTQKFKDVQNVAAQAEKPCLAMSSNLHLIIDANFMKTHTLRNAAVALILQKGISKMLYASGYAFPDIGLNHKNCMASLDPIILPLLSTERLTCIPTGSEHTRVEKTQIITNLPLSKKYLDVCVHPWNAKEGIINCSGCWKCLRTQLTFDLLGALEEYHEVFDLEIYRSLKNIYLIEIMKSDAPLSKEIKQMIISKNIKLPYTVRLISFISPQFVMRKVPGLILKLSRRKKIAQILNSFLSF